MTSLRWQLARGARHRHVVYPKAGGAGRAVDLAPPGPQPARATYPALGPPELSAEDSSFVRWLFEQGGVDARSYRVETLRRRLPACLRAVGAGSTHQARHRIEQDRSLISPAIGAVVIGVTSFFRDAAVVEHLNGSVLPALARHSAPLRVWSVGCSDGEELYSVAMLLVQNNLLDRAHLLGTDCRAGAVARAREGVYDAAALRDVRPEWRDEYFAQDAGRWRVRESLRSAARWRVGDATRQLEPGPWDLILCRNFAMYLHPGVASVLWQSLENLLRPGAFLVLGKAERPTGASFLDAAAPCIYRRSNG